MVAMKPGLSARLRRALRRAAGAAGVVLVLACSSEGDMEPTQVGSATADEGARSLRAEDPRPSVVLIVLDTVRADAVSAYGAVEGTTPHLDGLARKGLRYAKAYAPAPWTVSSHASLFSGLRVDQHGVGLDGRSVVPDSLPMLAEAFRSAGYTTAGFSENGLIQAEFGFDRGFDAFAAKDLVGNLDRAVRGEPPVEFRLLDHVRRWNARRDPSRPYFLFVNVFDAHDAYELRDTNRWVPEDLPREEVEYVASRYVVPQSLCDALPRPLHVEVLHGLYLGDVAAADAKVGELMEILAARDPETPRLVVATSDHGEHFGENRLMGHQFTVRNAALHVPLIVSGLPDTSPAVVETPVEIRALAGSLRCWALEEGCPASLPRSPSQGMPPVEPGEAAPIYSIYSDSVARMPDVVREHFGITREQEEAAAPSLSRARCEPEDHVFGEMVSMIRYPWKLTWFSDGQIVEHDLRWDPAERSDLAGRGGPESEQLREALEAFVHEHVESRPGSPAPELSPEAEAALKSLGYVR